MSITTIFNLTKDSYIRSNVPTGNYGTETVLSLGELGTSGVTRNGVFEFDVSSMASATDIVSANFTLFVINTFGTTEKTMTVARLDQDFTETTVTWNTSDGSTDWTGGAGASGNAVTALPTYSMTVGPGTTDQIIDIAALVRDAIINHAGILRLVIYLPTTAGSFGTTTFASRTNGTASNRPTLDVVVADRIAWDGSVNGNLETDDNWTPSGVPGANDIALFNSGTVNVSTGNLTCKRIYVGRRYQGNLGSSGSSISFDCDELRLGSPYCDSYLLVNDGIGTNTGVIITDSSSSMEIDGEYDPTIVRTRSKISLSSADVDTVLAFSRASFTTDEEVAIIRLIGAVAKLDDGAGSLICVNGANVSVYSVDNDDTTMTIHKARVRCLAKSIDVATVYSGSLGFKNNEQIDIRCEALNIYPGGMVDTRTKAATFGLTSGSTAQAINMYGGRLRLDPTYDETIA